MKPSLSPLFLFVSSICVRQALSLRGIMSLRPSRLQVSRSPTLKLKGNPCPPNDQLLKLSSPPSPLRRSTCLLAFRGGGREVATAAFDLAREKIRLDGLATYGVVTALIMGAALKLFSSTPVRWEGGSKKDRVMSTIFALLVTTCILCGAYTTIIFQLTGIYAKTALGSLNDAGYLEFIRETAMYRVMGFRCFLGSVLSFLLSFVISVYFRTREVPRRVVVGASLSLTCVAVFHIRRIVHLATALIFSP